MSKIRIEIKLIDWLIDWLIDSAHFLTPTPLMNPITTRQQLAIVEIRTRCSGGIWKNDVKSILFLGAECA